MQGINLAEIQEIREGITTLEQLTKNLTAGSAIVLKGRHRTVALGKELLVKVNTSIGVGNRRSVNVELEKVKVLSSVVYRPDTIMDLSIVRLQKPLYAYIIEEFGGPVGTLPHYICYRPRKGIDPKMLLEEIARQAEAGVGWMTLHLAVRKELCEKARKARDVPFASRGGGIVIDDMYINDRNESILSLYFDEILTILGKNRMALSIGTTFRPATTIDALDEVHREEISIQGEYIKEARNKGVQVMLEGIGHCGLAKIKEYIQIVKSKYDVPIMPLGPLPTDAAVGNDHVASAIGAAFMSFLGGADMINSVTREEHTGGIPSCGSIIEGLKAARIAAHCVNIAKFPQLDALDRGTSNRRAKNYTCVVEGGLFTESVKMRYGMGCQRCGNKCPLRIIYSMDKREGGEI